MATLVPFTPLVIDGQERPSANSESFEVHTPQSGQLVGTAASATSQDCRDAIDAAARALKYWEKTRPVERRNIFLKAADIFASERWIKLLQETNQQEIAFSPHWSTFDSMNPSNYLRTQAGLVDKLRGEFYPSINVPGVQVHVQPRAKGVLLAIAPWNAPATLTIRAIAIPIFCGNTVILKGSELTPRTHYLITKALHEAGLPKGVLNCISTAPSAAPSLVSEIIAHPQIRHINFTGSDHVGKIIAMEAAKHLKPCVLELGGKAPTIVLEDADLNEAAKAIADGAMTNSGQVCMSTERVIVHKSIVEDLTAAVRSIVSTFKAGDAKTDRSVKLGPLFSTKSADRLVRVLNNAKENGAEVILGDLSNKQAVVQPHIIKDVKPGMKIWDEESFGPVIVFATFTDVDEAIELANASTYSLTSSVWSADILAAQEVAYQMRYSCVNINGTTLHSEPFDGLMGLSGSSGYGRFSVENFTDKRTTIVHPKGRKYSLLQA